MTTTTADVINRIEDFFDSCDALGDRDWDELATELSTLLGEHVPLHGYLYEAAQCIEQIRLMRAGFEPTVIYTHGAGELYDPANVLGSIDQYEAIAWADAGAIIAAHHNHKVAA